MSNLFDLIEPTVTVDTSGYRPPELPDLSGERELFVDWESTGVKWWPRGEKKSRIVGAAVATASHSWYLPTRHRGSENIDEQHFREWACSDRGFRGKRITNLNTKFEVHMSREEGIDLEALGCEVSDVGHHVALLDDHRRRFSLEVISQEILGRGKTDEGLDKTRMGEYHAARVAPYAINDVALVRDLKAYTWPKLEAEGLHEVRQLEDETIFAVCEMERNGAPLDEELLHDYKKRATTEMHASLLQIHRDTGIKVNPDSAKSWEKLFHKLNIPVENFTEGGAPSFTDAVLEKVDDPTVQLARRAGKLADLLTKYINKYAGTVEDGVLRYALHQLRADDGGTVSGRFSSAAMKVGAEKIGANIQQVMAVKKQVAKYGDDYIIKELFGPWCTVHSSFARYCACVVKPQWIDADAKQIEYRLFGHYAQSMKIIEKYRENPDLKFHDLIWEMLLPFKPDMLYKDVKNLNFATIYGAGLAKIAMMMGYITEFQLNQLRREYPKGIPRDLPILAPALEIQQIYNREIPEVQPLLRRASKTALDRGFVKTLLGRRSRFPNGQRTHKALNAIIQGSAADIMKRKLVELHNARKYTGLTLRMTVHDAVAGDVPDEESARRVAEVLNAQSFETDIPILWDVKMGKNWAEAA